MQKSKDIDRILNTNGINYELLFATDVLGLKFLHYGYWDFGEVATLEKCETAQQRYTDTLIKLLPDGVKHILDIGCGVGDNAKTLIKKRL